MSAGGLAGIDEGRPRGKKQDSANQSGGPSRSAGDDQQREDGEEDVRPPLKCVLTRVNPDTIALSAYWAGPRPDEQSDEEEMPSLDPLASLHHAAPRYTAGPQAWTGQLG